MERAGGKTQCGELMRKMWRMHIQEVLALMDVDEHWPEDREEQKRARKHLSGQEEWKRMVREKMMMMTTYLHRQVRAEPSAEANVPDSVGCHAHAVHTPSQCHRAVPHQDVLAGEG